MHNGQMFFVGHNDLSMLDYRNHTSVLSSRQALAFNRGLSIFINLFRALIATAAQNTLTHKDDHHILNTSSLLDLLRALLPQELIVAKEGFSVMAISHPFEALDQVVEQTGPVIEHLANELWQLSELSLLEVKSAQRIIDVLREQGFTITSTGTANVPTAFIAEWGTGKPVLGLLAEYDALPGLGNEAVPYRMPRKDATSSGHGCGHNLFGATIIGAAIALKQQMSKENIPGTIRVYGCAAEETEGAKVYLVREKLFSDVDAVLHWHPGDRAATTNIRSLATNSLRIEFFGRSAHAGGTPWLGRSAVHAAEIFAHGVNLMREHVEPTARIHYIYEKGGEAPNIVPDYARVRLYVRDIDRERVAASTAWIKQIAQGAALATQTRAETLVHHGMYDLLPNIPLAERVQLHLERIGVPSYTEEELEFARETQRNYGVESQGMTTKIEELPDDTAFIGASTDVGDVSWNVPTMGCTMPTLPIGVPVHTWAATACHGMSIGLKGALYAARVLAATGMEIMTDAELRQQAWADFQRRTNGKTYRSPLADEMLHPLGVPAWMLEKSVLR
jgi:aminobenzoyl-glutamate utilization protein B